MPILPEFMRTLRTLTKDAGTILIFDEVVTGFRCSPGGAQQAMGITPDMTTLEEDFLPGLAGRRGVWPARHTGPAGFQAHQGEGIEKIAHPGTFNANPGVGRAGIANAGDPVEHRCQRQGQRAWRNDPQADERSVGGRRPEMAVHGSYSGFHVFTNPGNADITPSTFDPVKSIPT